MKKKKLYRYTKDDSVVISPDKPDVYYTEMLRLVADEGYILTNGEMTAYCIDTEDGTLWNEVKDQTEEEITTGKAQAYDILTGVSC